MMPRCSATSSLLPGYEGFFPSVDVGVARMLHARLGGEHRPWLRRLDLSALGGVLVGLPAHLIGEVLRDFKNLRSTPPEITLM